MSQQKYSSTALLALGLTTCAALLSACGGKIEDNRSLAIDFGKSTIASCLKDGGVNFVESSSELRFLSKAEADEEVSKSGLAYDKAANIIVNVWSKATFEGRPSRWIMWIGQPFGEKRTPIEIVDAKPPDSYVAFIVRPSTASRRMAEACIDFSHRKKDPPPVILHSDDFQREENE